MCNNIPTRRARKYFSRGAGTTRQQHHDGGGVRHARTPTDSRAELGHRSINCTCKFPREHTTVTQTPRLRSSHSVRVRACFRPSPTDRRWRSCICNNNIIMIYTRVCRHTERVACSALSCTAVINPRVYIHRARFRLCIGTHNNNNIARLYVYRICIVCIVLYSFILKVWKLKFESSIS